MKFHRLGILRLGRIVFLDPFDTEQKIAPSRIIILITKRKTLGRKS
jgi:hypothetical protein